MWTVLIFLNLGAVHCTVSSYPPSPINVTFSSVNLWNKLQWFPGSDSPEDTIFRVQYAIYGNETWRPVPRCWGMARNWCDLTNETRDSEQQYFARVRAARRTRRVLVSAWTTTRRFDPKTDTRFGPPLVSVEMGDGNAIVTLEGPMRYQPDNRTPAVSMATLYPEMTYVLSVKNTRAGATLHVPMKSSSYKYQLMEHNTEYCFSATTRFLSVPTQCLSSAPHCITTPQDPVIGQLLRVVVGIVVPSVCMCMVAVVSYLLHNYLTGKGQKSPYILNLPAFPPPALAFHPESPNPVVITIIKDVPESPECAKRQQHAPHRPPGYASQGRQIPPQPEEPSIDDWSDEYGFVAVSPEVPVVVGDSYEKKEWRFEEDHSAGRSWTESLAQASARLPTPTSIQGAAVREDGGSPGVFVSTTPRNGRYRVPLNPPTNEGGRQGRVDARGSEEVPLLSAGSTDTPSSASDLVPADYGVVRPASENGEAAGSICLDWNPETGKLVLQQMDGWMQGEKEEEEKEEEEELRLENVYVRQWSEEKAEARREMEGGRGKGWDVEDFSNRWNLVVSMD